MGIDLDEVADDMLTPDVVARVTLNSDQGDNEAIHPVTLDKLGNPLHCGRQIIEHLVGRTLVHCRHSYLLS
jgi:hypothetical protein